MDISNIVVHRLHKEQNELSTIGLSDELIEADEYIQSLLSSITKLFNKKSSKGWGVFHEENINYPLSTELKDYLDETQDFLSFTRTAMSVLEGTINNQNFATGGYLLFIHYDEYLMVIMLDEKEGTAFDDYQLKPIKYLNLDNLHQAARINLPSWEADIDEKYISFIRGPKNQKFSKYFLEFIGCDDFAESKQQTRKLVQAIDDFYESKNFSLAEKNYYNNHISKYCDEKQKAREPISLEELAPIACPDAPDDFLEHCRDDEYQLNDSFEIDRVEMKKLTYVVYRSPDLTLNFDTSLLETSIDYDRESKSITIRNLPEALADQLDFLTCRNE